jgi:hypothetical protein
MTQLYNAIQIDDELDVTIELKEWSKITGVSLATLQSRVRRGWNMKEVLYRKVRFNKTNPSNFNSKIHEKVGAISEGVPGNAIQLI